MTPRRRPSSSSTFALVLLVMLSVLPAASARAAGKADDAEAQARKRFNRGKQLYDEHKYREAALEFEAGYAIVPKPGFLLNIGHSYRRAGEGEKARHYYELFLEKDKTSAQRGEVQGYIKGIDDALADQREKEAHASRPPAPAAPAAETPRPSRPVEIIRTTPEAKAAPATAAGPPYAALGERPAPAEALHAEACPEPPRSSSSRWPWVVAGVAVVAGGIAAAVALTRGGGSEPCGTLGCLRER